jgi:membrane-bound PQQ-dependent dehydrogenase (glucose/quinate/shikimate family)
MPNENRPRAPRIFAALLGLIGLFLFCGGAWLLAMGGSLYYVIAGAAILLSSILLWMRNPLGSAVYQLTAMASVLWALWETGYDFWTAAPRVALLIVLMAWLYTPWVRRSLGRAEPDEESPNNDSSDKKAAAAIAITFLCGAALLGTHQLQAQTGPQHAATGRSAGEGDWRHYGNSIYGSHYSTLDQINRDNVSQLQRAWTYRSGDSPRESDLDGAFAFHATPIEIGDTLYFCTPHSSVIALNADNGQERWRFDPGADTANAFSLSCRGVAYHARQGASGACARRIIGATADARLYALDAESGQLCADFGKEGFVRLTDSMGDVAPGTYLVPSPPTIVGDRVLVGGAVAPDAASDAPSGVIRAFNVRNGRQEWAWDMGRAGNGPAKGAGDYTRGTPHASTPFAADPFLGLVYVATGSPPLVTDGTDLREFDKRYANSIVALELSSGNPRWSFQTTRGDVWDYGHVAQPVLVDLPAPGGVQRAVVQATKYGDIFVLDRATGRPVRDTYEAPAPAGSGLPLSRTQLRSEISLLPDPLGEKDMWGVTPLDQLVCRIKFKRARYDGPFTPPGLTPAITFPGAMGTIGWGGIAVDQRSKLIIVNTNAIASYDRIVRNEDGSYEKRSEPFLGPLGVPCNEPPWGFLEFIDLKTNDHFWKRPIGTARDSGPLGIPSMLPIGIGTPSLGGAIVTEGALTIHGGTADNYLRAYELYTGEELWRARLPAGAQATPMTYATSSGRQFIVIAAGGDARLGTKTGDYLVAYALPQG